MKAIYINLDPYLAAFAAWLKGGKSGPAPSGPSVPLAVTIPLGADAAIYLNGYNEDGTGLSSEYFTIDEQYIGVLEEIGAGDSIVENVVPALSPLIPAAHYYVRPVTGGSLAVTVILSDEDGNEFSFAIPVLVRRETASGPVDLVDFTPPAAAPSAADIKSALVAAGDTALAGVSLNGAQFDDGELKVLKNEAAALSRVAVTAYDDASGTDILTVLTPGS